MKLEVVNIEEQSAVAMRRTVSMKNLQSTIRECYAKLYTYITEQGGTVAHWPYVAYLGLGSEFEIEMGFPVDHPLPNTDEIFMSKTAGGRAVTMTHQGAYSSLEAAYNSVFLYINDNHFAPSGAIYEFYINDPAMTPQAELLTKIVAPIKDETVIICQSCGMPMTADEHFALEANGEKNEDYCSYCYKDGQFTSEMTMAEMIDLNSQYTDQWGIEITKEQAIAQMNASFPYLKRWRAN